MDKKVSLYYCIVTVVIIGLAIFLSLYLDLDNTGHSAELIKPQTTETVTHLYENSRKVLGVNLFEAICFVLAVGYLLWTLLFKNQKMSRPFQIVRGNYLHKATKIAECAMLLRAYLSRVFYRNIPKNEQNDTRLLLNCLYKISRISGDSEYDIFFKSAANWPISNDRVDRDFRRYLSDQSLPYYVTDYLRKKRDHIDELEKEKEEQTPTTWRDWAKAMLVFPGSIVFMALCLFLN